MSFKFKGLPEHVQAFGVCVILHMLFPFLPLGLELLHTGGIGEGVLVLFASLYGLTIGTSSRSQLLFTISIFAGFFFAVAYGFSLGSGESMSGANTSAMVAIIAIFLVHFCERFNRHVVERRPFFEFGNGGDGDAAEEQEAPTDV